jgi:hypothetical protein
MVAFVVVMVAFVVMMVAFVVVMVAFVVVMVAFVVVMVGLLSRFENVPNLKISILLWCVFSSLAVNRFIKFFQKGWLHFSIFLSTQCVCSAKCLPICFTIRLSVVLYPPC